jgi:hypothetical protein
MRGAITESDIGPADRLRAVQEPAEAKRIAALPAYKQAAEIAKIEEKLTAAAPKADPDENEDDEPDATRSQRVSRSPSPPTVIAIPTARSSRKKSPRRRPTRSNRSAADPLTPVPQPSDKDDPDTWRKKRVAELEARKPRR